MLSDSTVMERPGYEGQLQEIQPGRPMPAPQGVEMALARNEVFALEGDQLGYRILCQKGRLWITQANDMVDYVLSAGEEFVVSGTGMVVIQALLSSQALIRPRRQEK